MDGIWGRRRFQSPRSLQAMIPIIALGTEAQDESFILDPEARVIGARGRPLRQPTPSCMLFPILPDSRIEKQLRFGRKF